MLDRIHLVLVAFQLEQWSFLRNVSKAKVDWLDAQEVLVVQLLHDLL